MSELEEVKKSRGNYLKIISTVVFMIFTLPTTIVAAPFSLSAFVGLIFAGITIPFVLLSVTGWIGIRALWRLHLYLYEHNAFPVNTDAYYWGLSSGAATSFALIVWFKSDHSMQWAASWPLLATLVYACLYAKSSLTKSGHL